MSFFSPLTLEGRYVRLEPLRPTHVDGLLAAAFESLDTFTLTPVPRSADTMRRYVEQACDDASNGVAFPFATVDRATGRVVGSTRFYRPERWDWPGAIPGPVPDGPDGVELGWTWLAASAQRTPINSEAKLLMFKHAFELARVRRVHLKTDVRNVRSRAAMERLGAQFDGVLRAQMPATDGGVRDSAYYSVLREDWPVVKARLEVLVARRDRSALPVEKANPDDASAVATLLLGAQPGARVESIRRAIASGALAAWIVRDGADVVATCAMEDDPSVLGLPGAATVRLSVLDYFRDRGLEPQLIAVTLAHARTRGVRALRVNVASPERSHFTRAGFQSQLTEMTLTL